jgi:hypothetical protein
MADLIQSMEFPSELIAMLKTFVSLSMLIAKRRHSLFVKIPLLTIYFQSM